MSGLSDRQFDVLWAVSLGSKGRGSNGRTLESLRRRGLVMQMRHQGEVVWEVTPQGESAINDDQRSEP